MGLFDKRKEFSRSQLKQELRKASGAIPGTSTRIGSSDRVKLEKEFESKYGSHISESDARREIYEQRRLKAKEKTYKGKMEIDRKIRYLEGFFGVK